MRQPRTTGLLVIALATLMVAAQLAGAVPSAHAAPAHSTFTVCYPLFLQAGYYVYPVKYFVPPTAAPATAAMQALIAGLPEKGDARIIALPKDTKVSVSIKDGVCTVDFSEEIRQLSVGSGGESAVISAIVSTLSQFPSVNWVNILVGGKPVETLAGHVDITGPLAKNVGPYFQVLDDMTQHWAGGAVAVLELSDVIAGYEDATFRPENKVTRAEFVKMLVEGLRLPEDPAVAQPFKDVTGHWAVSYVQRAISSGLLKAADYGDYLKPDEVIPREEMASLLVTASTAYLAAHPEVQYKIVSPAPVFTDMNSAEQRYVASIQESARLGLLNGYPGGAFQPKAGLTRAEAATVITRLLGMASTSSIVRITPPMGFKWDGKSFSVLAAASAFEATVNLRLSAVGNSDIFGGTGWVNATLGMGWGALGVYVDSGLLAGQTAASFDLYLISMADGHEYGTVSLPLNLK